MERERERERVDKIQVQKANIETDTSGREQRERLYDRDTVKVNIDIPRRQIGYTERVERESYREVIINREYDIETVRDNSR